MHADSRTHGHFLWPTTLSLLQVEFCDPQLTTEQTDRHTRLISRETLSSWASCFRRFETSSYLRLQEQATQLDLEYNQITIN